MHKLVACWVHTEGVARVGGGVALNKRKFATSLFDSSRFFYVNYTLYSPSPPLECTTVPCAHKLVACWVHTEGVARVGGGVALNKRKFANSLFDNSRGFYTLIFNCILCNRCTFKKTLKTIKF